MSYTVDGATGLLKSASVEAYSNALKGLNLEQAKLVLSTKQLSDTQKEQILTEAGLLKTTGDLTTAQLTEILTSKTRTAADAQALLINTGLITSETAEATATNTVTAAKLKELVATKQLTQAEANLIAKKAGITMMNGKETASILGNIGSKIKGAGSALAGFGKGVLTLASAHPVIAGITAAITVFGGAAIANKIKQEKAAKAIKEAYEEAKTAIDEINNNYESNTSKTKSIAQEYAELAQGVDLLTNKNKNLSTEKHERFLELSNELSRMYPSLTKNFDDNGNAILDLSGDVDTIVGSLDDLIERQRALANQEIVDKMPDLFAGFSNNVSDYKKEVESAKKTEEAIRQAYDNLKRYGFYSAFEVDGYGTGDGKRSALGLGGTVNNLKALGMDVVTETIKDEYGQAIGTLIKFADGTSIAFEDIHDAFVSSLHTASTDVRYAEQQLDAEKSKINQYLNTWLQTEFSYSQIQDEGLQKAVQEMMFNFDWDSLPEGIDKNDWEAVSEYLRRNILFAINNVQDNPEISNAISELFTNQELSPEQANILIKQIQDYFGKDNPISVFLQPQFKENETTQKSIDSAISKFGEGSKGDLKAFFEKNSINTQEEVDKWNEITKGTNNATEAMEKYVQGSTSLNKMTVSLSEMEKASDKISKLGSAFKELSDDGYITTKTLGEIQTVTGLSGDEWAEYESKLLNAKKGSAEFSQIMADLTYKMLDQTFANKDLNSLTEQQISAILRENGVVNADAVAHDWLTKAKETLRIKTALAKASTAEAVVALATEASQAGITGNALNDLIMDMGIFNNTNLDVSQKVAALQEMGYYAHWTAQGLANIDKVKKYSFDGKDYIASYDKDGKLVGIEQEKQVEIPNVEIPKITIPNYSGVTSGGKSGSDKDKPDYEDPTDAIINRINLRSKEIEQQEEYIQNSIEIAKIMGQEEHLISLTNALIATRKKRVDELTTANAGLHNEAEYLRNNNPWDEESWFDSQGNATEAYYNALNSASTKEEQEQIKDLFESLSKYKEAYKDNAEEILALNKEILQDEEALSELHTNAYDGRVRDIEHARDMALEANPFADTTSYYKQLQDEYHKEAERLRALDPEKYKEEIQKLQLAWHDAQNEIVSWRFNNSQNWIDERNRLGDWELFNDNEVDAWKRVIKYLKEEYPNELDKIKEAEESLYNARKEAMDKSLEDIDKYISARNIYNDWDNYGDSEFDAVARKIKIVSNAFKEGIISAQEYNDTVSELQQTMFELAKQNATDELNFKLSQVGSLKTLLQSFYDVQNAVSDAQYQINKELAASMTMTEYLNEETRKLLFNQKDYNILSKELTNIQNKAFELQEDFNNDILNATSVNLDEITSKYQMQYETLMKSYEIAKAELEVAKKRQQLDNVLNERNVRMFINGQWQWVANTQDVINAQNELADAEYAVEQAKNSLAQKEAVNELTKTESAINTTLNNINEGLIDFNVGLNNINTESVPALENIVSGVGYAISDFISSLKASGKTSGSSSSSSKTYEEFAKAQMKANSEAWHTASDDKKEVLHNANTIIGNSIGMTYDSASGKWIKRYASGTKNTKAGTALMGEDGFEVYIDSNGHRIPVMQPTVFKDIEPGGKVFNTEQLKGLSSLWELSNVGKFNSNNYPALTQNHQNVNNNTDNSYHVHIQNLEVDSDIIDIDALRRFVGNHR